VSGTGSTYIGKEPHGIKLVAIVVILSLANFLAVLDMTIANVLVPHIAGSLASTPSNGTWVITGYTVAEAVMVPLTGWLIQRFGPVKVFVVCLLGFGALSLACGLATSLGMLIFFRVLLGIAGGPLIPISQTLLIKIVPTRHANAALGAWAMTTVLAPIVGPVIGGVIGDNWSWEWAFYFKVPLAAVIAFFAWRLLQRFETPANRERVDFGGLGLLVLWVGALQIMLGKGQDLDWFNSHFIVGLLIATLIGFVCFVIWESSDRKPIVSLRVYTYRTFSVSQVAIGLSFGCIMGTSVLVPLWLQTAMGYTATWAGLNAALSGITMVIFAPITTWLMGRYDARGIAFVGLLFIAAASLMRVGYTDQVTFWQMMWPQFVFGAGCVVSVIPLMDMATSSLDDRDVADGASQFNFVRTLACAIATAAVVAMWDNLIRSSKAALVGAMPDLSASIQTAQGAGVNAEQAHGAIDLLVQGQAVQQATNNSFLVMGLITLAAAASVWFAPKPRKKSSATAKGH
jgi:MFS transporter, DHA2 family, multidrug resistance protein